MAHGNKHSEKHNYLRGEKQVMTSNRYGVSFKTKIFGIAASLLIMLMIIATFSYNRLGLVRDEVHDLSERLIPILGLINEVDALALEQEVHFERILKLYEIQPLNIEHIAEEQSQFEKRSEKVDEALKSAIRLAQNQHRPPQEQDLNTTLIPVLTNIKKEHTDLHDHARQIITLLKNSEKDAAHLLEDNWEKEQGHFDQEVETIRQQLQNLNANAAQETRTHQRHVLQLSAIITAIASIIGIRYTTLLTRGITRPVQELMGAMRSVEQGNLDVDIKAVSADEIGSIATAFSTMVDQLKLKEKIKNTFGKYVDPRVVDTFMEQTDKLETGGEKQVMTVSFTDINGLNTILDRLEPEEQIDLINQYLDLMSKPIYDRKGVIDKYINTMVMAFWGPPFTDEKEHAELACLAALDQLEKQEEIGHLLGKFAKEDIDSSHFGILVGLSAGPLVVGNMGSEQSMSYTVLGDTVNTASRLKGASKQYGTRSLITEETKELIDETIEVREIDLIRVVGKETPVRVYELLGSKGDVASDRLELKNVFEQGLSAYRDMQWDQARQHFETCQKLQANDGPSEEYLNRVNTLQQDPPDDGWDGVWSLTQK